MIFWNIIIAIASYALQLLLTPKPQNAKPKSLQDFQLPTAEEGRRIPVHFGTNDEKGPNVTWYGDLKRKAIKGARRYGLFGPRQILGYKYYLGMQMGLCHGPADYIYSIRVGDKEAWNGQSSGGRIAIDKSNLFGGDKSEGGISGDVDICMGAPDQLQNDYLVSVLGEDQPAYRGVVTAVLRQVYLGTSAYIKPWEFKLQRIHKRSDGSTQWYDAKAAIPSNTSSGTGAKGSRKKRTITNVNTDNANAHVLDVAGSTLAHFNPGLTDLIIEDVKTGDILATVSLAYTPLWVYVSTSTGEVLVADTVGIMHVYGTDGSVHQTVGSWGDPTPVGDPTGQLTRTPCEIVIAGTTYMAFWVTFNIVLFANDGSGWAPLWSAYNGLSSGQVSDCLAIGPDYIYTKQAYGGIVRFGWSIVGLGTRTVIDITAFGWDADNINALAYIESSDTVVLHGTDGQFLVVSGDMETLVAFTDLGSWNGDSGTAHADQLGSRRMLNGSDTAVFYKANSTVSSSSVYLYSTVTGAIIQRISALEWDIPLLSGGSIYAGFSETEQALVIYDATHGAYVLFLPKDYDMNPAHIIRECLTDATWGMGYNDGDIDDVSFTAAADTFYDEGFGLSMKWSREEEIQEFVQVVQSHVDAYLYLSRSTGKFVLKPIRNDYDIDTIPVVTEDDVIEWTEVVRRQPSEAVSSVVIKFYDREKRQDGSHIVTNNAQAMQATKVISTSREYPGINDRTLAVRVATRDVLSLGSGMISGRLQVKRTLEGLNPGDPFRLVSERHELSGQVMRAADLSFGDGRTNKISLKIIQDVFNLGAAVLVDSSDSDWENPSAPPLPASPRLVWEMPFREMRQMIGDVQIDSMLGADTDAGLLQVAASRPSADASDATMDVDSGSGYEDVDTLDFAPGGFLDGSLAIDGTSIDIIGGQDIDDIAIGSLAAISATQQTAEVVRIDAIAGTTLTIARGCLDTVPQAHDDGSAIVFFDDFSLSDFEVYTAGDNVSVKLLTTTGIGTLELSGAPADVATFGSRPIRPYPPADCQIDGIGYGTIDATALPLIPASWARRNRLTESTPLDWDDADVTPEASQTVTLRLLDPGGIVIDDTTYTGIAGTTQDIDPADFSGAASGYVEFLAVRDGYESWQNYRLRVLVSTIYRLTSGDEQSGTDRRIFSGDAGSDRRLLSGTF